MSRITRVTQKIFGSTAGTNQIAQFGSLAASSPVFSTSVAVIQALSNYLQGWFGGVIGENSPCIEDMNGLFYVITSQLAEIFQAGTPEWDSGTTYYTGSIVQDGGTGISYASLQDTNLNEPLSNGAWWGPPPMVGLLTSGTLPFSGSSYSIPTANTLFLPHMVIQNTLTVTVTSGAYLLSVTSLIVSGTLIVASGGNARVIS